MKRTKRMVLTGVTLAALGGALVTSTAPVEASSAGVSSVAKQMPSSSPSTDVTVYWWVAAGAALAGGAAGGAVGGAVSCGPGGALAGAAAGGVGGFVGYAISSLFGVKADAVRLDPSAVHALD